MSQTTLNRITVKQKPGTEKFISNGANTQIFLDGAPLKGVTFLKFEFKPAKPTKIVLEMFANVDEIDGHYELGQYSPVTKSEPGIGTNGSMSDTDRLNYLVNRPGIITFDKQGRAWVGPQEEPGMGPFVTFREAIDAAMGK